MSRFHLMHSILNPRVHGLNGYRDVIDTIQWGLEQLGHEVTYSVNEADSSAINIIFGAQTLPIDFLEQLPSSSIVYNMEQLRNLSASKLKPALSFAAKQFEIWDYCSANLPVWRECGTTRLQAVPIGYAPVITRIEKPPVQDIDVLMYGISGDKRLNVLDQLSRFGLKTVFASGLYGDSRDNLISRSKVVINVNLYGLAKIFEIVRVSYLLANRKAVMAVKEPDTFIEPDIESVVKFTTVPDRLIDDCFNLIEQDDTRIDIEKRGFESFSRRDIRHILTRALSERAESTGVVL